MVAKQNPQKSPDPGITFEDRYRMVTMACQGTGDPRLIPCDIEASLDSPFTCDTLQCLREMWPACDDKGKSQFVLIIGSDCYYNLNTWKNYQDILRYHRVYVYDRPGSRLKNINLHPDWSDMVFISPGSNTLLDVSSTKIRMDVADNIRDLLDPKVYDYIIQRNLYDWLPI
jgi:nicotinate-nucleotide adenylyltransferase